MMMKRENERYEREKAIAIKYFERGNHQESLKEHQKCLKIIDQRIEILSKIPDDDYENKNIAIQLIGELEYIRKFFKEELKTKMKKTRK